MSEKNVELVQGVFDAVARGDTEAVLAAYDPDVEYDFTQSAVGHLFGTSNMYRGHDGIREWVRERFDAMAELEDVCQQLIDAGPHVISSVITRGRGRSSGAETELRHYGVWTIRNDKVIKVAWFHTLADAASAAGV